MLGVKRYLSNELHNIVVIMKYASGIAQVILLTNATCYLSDEVTVTNIILFLQVTKLLISLLIH